MFYHIISSMVKTILFAYTGGLDAAVSLHWLTRRGYDVLTYTADIGQKDDFRHLEDMARRTGATNVRIEDLKGEFVTGYIFPARRADAVYEGRYLLGGALPKPLIASKQAQLAKAMGIDIVAHGATQTQNDRIRFENAYRVSFPGCTIYAPWCDPEFASQFGTREDLLAYAHEHGIPSTTTAKRSWTTEQHLFHTSFEDSDLLDLSARVKEDMIDFPTPQQAPDKTTEIRIHFTNGNPVSVDYGGGNTADPLNIMQKLNKFGSVHGIGVVDMVETNIDGTKSRGIYVTPGGTILHAAHMDLGSVVLSGGELERRHILSSRFAKLAYSGHWFSDEMKEVMAEVDSWQHRIRGFVDLALYKGNVIVLGRNAA